MRMMILRQIASSEATMNLHPRRCRDRGRKKKEPTDPVRDILKPKPAHWPKPKPRN
jgi:hypothetical protein